MKDIKLEYKKVLARLKTDIWECESTRWPQSGEQWYCFKCGSVYFVSTMDPDDVGNTYSNKSLEWCKERWKTGDKHYHPNKFKEWFINRIKNGYFV